MRRAIPLVLAFAGFAAAAPVPNTAAEVEKITKLFGTPVDADKDCRFRLDGDKLTVTVPDKMHDLIYDGTANAPRTARDIKGDFVVRVKVVCKLPESPKPVTGNVGEYAAGLVLYADAKHAVRMDIARRVEANGPGGPQIQTRTWQAGGGGSMSSTNDGKATPAAPLWLRLTRRGNTVTSAYSHDGENWRTFSNNTGDLPDALKVGVQAAHSCDAGFTATFEGFAVEPLAARK